jgi:hypothetical protein
MWFPPVGGDDSRTMPRDPEQKMPGSSSSQFFETEAHLPDA